MKKLLLLSMILVSCGKEELKPLKEPDDMEVTQISASTDEHAVGIDYATSHEDLFTASKWTVVAVMQEGEIAPRCNAKGVDIESTTNNTGYISFGHLKPNTVYSVRLCAHRPSDKYYSHGIARSFKTKAEKEEELTPMEDEPEEEYIEPEVE